MFKKYYVAYYTEIGCFADCVTTKYDLSTEDGIVALTQNIKTKFNYKSLVIINLIPLKG